MGTFATLPDRLDCPRNSGVYFGPYFASSTVTTQSSDDELERGLSDTFISRLLVRLYQAYVQQNHSPSKVQKSQVVTELQVPHCLFSIDSNQCTVIHNNPTRSVMINVSLKIPHECPVKISVFSNATVVNHNSNARPQIQGTILASSKLVEDSNDTMILSIPTSTTKITIQVLDLNDEEASTMYLSEFKLSNAELSHISDRLWINNQLLRVEPIYGIYNNKNNNSSNTETSTQDHDSLCETIDGGNCVVCMSSKVNVCLIPCRHACLCQGKIPFLQEFNFSGCMLGLQCGKCPVCRTSVEHQLWLQL